MTSHPATLSMTTPHNHGMMNTPVTVSLPPPPREHHSRHHAPQAGGGAGAAYQHHHASSGDYSHHHAQPPPPMMSNANVVTGLPVPEDEPNDEITKLRENDVLLGRGGGTNNHMGNIKFRKLIQEHKMRYLACSKVDKPKVAREVVQIWRKLQPPGRFLARKGGDGTANGNDNDNSDHSSSDPAVPTEAKPQGDQKEEEGRKSPVEGTCSSGSAITKPTVWYDVGDKKANAKASQCLRERTPEVMPYLRQLREQQDLSTEQGVLRFRQQQQEQQEREQQLQRQKQQQQHENKDPNSAGSAATSAASLQAQLQQQQHAQLRQQHQEARARFQQQQQQHVAMYHHPSPTHQREALSLAEMQRQQQHMLMQMNQPQQAHHLVGAGGQVPYHQQQQHHPMSMPSSHHAEMAAAAGHGVGIPMAPHLAMEGSVSPTKISSDPASEYAEHVQQQQQQRGHGGGVDEMTDLEYEQSMMIMQQQLQMQQMQLKRMQQQRALQRAALQQQQAQLYDLTASPEHPQPVPVPTTAAQGASNIMPPPLAAAHPAAATESESGVSEDSTEMPPPPPQAFSAALSPRRSPPLPHSLRKSGLSRHPGIMAPGSLASAHRSRDESEPSEDEKKQELSPKQETPSAGEAAAAEMKKANDGDVASLEDDNAKPKTAVASSLARGGGDSSPPKAPKRSISGTSRPRVPDRAASFMSIGSASATDDPKSLHPHQQQQDATAELTLEEYRQQLERYIADHSNTNFLGGGGETKVPEDDDGDSDLEDDWEQEQAKAAAAATAARPGVTRNTSRNSSRGSPSRKGVDRHKSNTSMMSMDTKLSQQDISIFSGLSDDLGAGIAAYPRISHTPGRSVSNQSHLSIMSELTDLSQNMDELSIREE